MVNLQAFLARQQCSRSLSAVLMCIAESCVKISELVERGALANILGETKEENVQGETQKKLDIIANDLLIHAFRHCKEIAAIASEEEDSSLALNEHGQYLVAFDPLDGSSNIDVNGQIGSIFSVLARKQTVDLADESQFLQKGIHQLAAIYVIYGASTQLVLNTGASTHLFTLDPTTRDFVLTQDSLSIPSDTQEFSINMSNQRFWSPAFKHYIHDLLDGETGPRGKRFNMRWNASMVGDVHRVLLRGGIFLYPSDSRNAQQPAKLRLLYEANPMALLIKGAGGKSINEERDILDVQPLRLHQRIAVILGSANEVDICFKYLQKQI